MPLKTWSRSLPLMLFLLALPALSPAQMTVSVSVGVPPPELPVYEQPPIPGDGYIWTPGYWGWSEDDQDYYWVPGTWVLAPQPEFLWTPGYWGAEGAAFIWHLGYWGPHVGFYGGVNYGYGYMGRGYEGGYWQGGRLYYNRSVNNITNTNITNVYNKTVINNVTDNRVSYNGGNGGVRVQPTPAEQAATRERHIPVIPVQRQHEEAARSNPVLRVSENHGRPPIAATPRPAAFSGPGVVPARGGNPSVVRPQTQPRAEAQQQGQFQQPRAEAQQQGQFQQPRAEAQPRTQPQPPTEAQPRGQPPPRTEVQPRVQPQTRVMPPPAPPPAPHPAAPPPPPRPPVQSRPAPPPPPVEQRRPPEPPRAAPPPRQGPER
jgi:hypothetical protein